MNKAYIVRQPEGNLEIYYDSEPMQDEDGYWDHGIRGRYDTLYDDQIPYHPSISELTNEDRPVEVMIAPVDKINMSLDTDYYLKIAKALRPLWPAGNKADKYPWRDSVENLAKRLKTLWEIRHMKDYTVEECVRAANMYLNKYQNDTTYMQTLRYFILKQHDVVGANGRIHYTSQSMFADILDSNTFEEESFEALAQQQGTLI